MPVGGTGKTGGTAIHDDKKGRGEQLYVTRNIHLFIHPSSMPYINRRTATRGGKCSGKRQHSTMLMDAQRERLAHGPERWERRVG